MVILRKLFFRIIKKYLRLFISMVIITSFGIASIVGLFSVHSNLVRGVDNYILEYGYQDILIDITPTNKDYSKIKEVSNVEIVEERLAIDVSVVFGSNIKTARLFTYKDTSFKKFYIREEKNGPGIGIPIYMDYDYATSNNIKIGDIVILGLGEKSVPCYLDKIVSSPECISIKQNKYFYGESDDYGYIFVDEGVVSNYLEELGYKGYYNELQILTDKKRTNYLVYEDIVNVMSSDYEILDYTLFEDSLVKCSIDMNIPTIYSITTIVPPIFFIIIMLVIFLFMYQILNQEKKNIGIFKSMGFKDKEILPLFLAIGGFVALVSTIIGLILAYILNVLVMDLYFRNFQMPKFIPDMDFGIIIIVCLANLFVCLLASLFSSYPIFKIEPSEAMMIQGADIRDPKTIKKMNVPLSVKLSISIVIRNLKRFVFSSFCISSAIIMLLCALLVNHSGDVTIEQTYNVRFNFDCLVYYTKPLDSNTIKAYDESDVVLKYEIMKYHLVDDDKENKFVVVGLDDYDMMRIVGEDGSSLIEAKDGIILSTRIADLLGKKKGDMVTISNKEIVVDDISRQYASSVCYMKKSKMEELNLDSLDVVLANITSKDSMTSFVSKTNNYLSVEYKENLYLYTMSCYNNIRPIVYLVIGMALIIGSVIIYNISQINLVESSREIAIMKSLGVRSSYINRTWLVESIFKYILALIFGIPIGTLLSAYCLNEMKSRIVEYPFDMSFVIVLLTAFLTLLFVLVSHFLSMRRIEKWNLADLCRQKE